MDDYFAAKSRLVHRLLAGAVKAHKAAVIYGERSARRQLIAAWRARTVWRCGAMAKGRRGMSIRCINQVAMDVVGFRGKIRAKERTADI